MYKDLAEWMPEFHKTGAKLFIQLTAGFGRSFTISEMMEKLYTNPFLRKVSKPFMDLDKITATASASPNRWSDKVPSRAMTKEEITEFKKKYGLKSVPFLFDMNKELNNSMTLLHNKSPQSFLSINVGKTTIDDAINIIVDYIHK